MHMNQRAINKNTLVFRNNNSSTSLHQSGVIRQEKIEFHFSAQIILNLKSYVLTAASHHNQLLSVREQSVLLFVEKNQSADKSNTVFVFVFCISYSLILIDYILLCQPSNFECISYSISIFI